MFSGGIEKDKWHEIGYDSNHALSCLNEISKIQQRIKFKLSLKVSQNYRSSHRMCSVGKGVLRNAAKFKGKHLCQKLFFNKVAGLKPATVLKESLTQVFSCEFCELLRTPFLQNTSGRLLLELI